MATMTADNVKNLIKACDPQDLQAKAFLDLAFHSGLRCAELCALRWGDVRDYAVTVENGKGGKRRVVALATTYGWFEQWKAMSGAADSDFVFQTRKGTPWATSHVRRLLLRLRAATGINCHSHSLRHGHACALWAATKDLGKVNHQLGHANMQTTGIYLRGRTENIQEIAAVAF